VAHAKDAANGRNWCAWEESVCMGGVEGCIDRMNNGKEKRRVLLGCLRVKN
jgi:hypothetical protein